jgi:hypothetical protein
MTLEDIFPKKRSFVVQINYPSFGHQVAKFRDQKKLALVQKMLFGKIGPQTCHIWREKNVGIAIFRSQVLLVCGPLFRAGFKTNLLLSRTHSQI